MLDFLKRKAFNCYYVFFSLYNLAVNVKGGRCE